MSESSCYSSRRKLAWCAGCVKLDHVQSAFTAQQQSMLVKLQGLAPMEQQVVVLLRNTEVLNSGVKG